MKSFVALIESCLLESTGPHKFSSVQLQMPKDLTKEIKRLGRSIPDELLGEDGREDDIHLTLLYGLHDKEPGEFKEYFQNQRSSDLVKFPIELKLGKIGFFDIKDGKVMKIAVEASDDLKRLNKDLKSFPHTNKHPRYQPHVTIAFLKSTDGLKYDPDQFKDRIVKSDHIIFSSADGTRTKCY